MKKLYNYLAVGLFGILFQIHLTAQVNCNDMVYISTGPWDGVVDLDAEWFVEGGDQYDQLFIDVAQIDCDDIGTPVDVVITAILGSDTSSCMSVAILEDKTPPVPIVVQNAIVTLDANGTATITADDIDNGSWDNCGSVELSVDPSSFSCADIGTNPVVTMTATDPSGNTNTSWSNVTIIQDLGPFACNAETTINVDDGPVLMTPADIVDNFGAEGCEENFTLVITDASGSVVLDNIIWSAYSGTTLTATVSNSIGNSCFGTIIVEGEADCDDFTEDNITWPENITVAIFGISTDSLSPANLIEFFGVDSMNAMPTIVDYNCENLIGTAYSDQIIIIDNFSFKVLRTWTILNWLTSEVYEHVQVIDNLPLTDFICDTLSRSAPVGDCDTGHSLEDDVEWPDDLFIQDYRISPEELIIHSGIDPLDAEPSFYNEPDNYSASYVDYLLELQAEELTLGREWTVERDDAPGAFWIYQQTIVVDLGSFSNLVTIETITNRPVPDVQVTQTTITDEEGNATVETNDLISPWLEDDPQNGLDLLDLFIMRQGILAINPMNALQNLAADVNQTGSVTTLDLVIVERIILGIETEIGSNWWFEEKPSDNNLSPRAQYYAIKPGDVNDSAILSGNNFAGEGEMKFQDQLLNAGEIYEIPFFLSEDMNSYGYQFSFNVDNAALEVMNVATDHFSNSLSFNQTENGVLDIIALNKGEAELANLTSTDPIFTVQFRAKENTVLSWSLGLNENRVSFAIDESEELTYFVEVIDGEIISGLDDLEILEGVNVFPNPATEFIKITADQETLNQDYTFNLINSSGQLIYSNKNTSEIDIQSWSNGIYYYTLVQGSRLAKGKVVIAK